MRPSFHLPVPIAKNKDDNWIPSYPNLPDLRFNYFKLLNAAAASGSSIGSAPATSPTVAIVGAGVAGLTAARELYRCGYKIILLEATNRICGRQYSKHVPGQNTAMELGAMRFPFFDKVGSQNCLLDYYLNTEAGAAMLPFPNPGSAPGGTGIYINGGYGPPGQGYSAPTLIPWPAAQGYNPPENAALKGVYDKVYAFQSLVTNIIQGAYTGADWDTLWKQIANNYEQMSFGDLVFTEALTNAKEYKGDGWFGGFGMSEEESALFYVIGTGDGSWGAFYEVASMWFLRCVMFGFSSNLQSVVGITDKSGLPYYGQNTIDSDSNDMGVPYYQGIQTLGEWLMYQAPPGMNLSLYDASKKSPDLVQIHVNSPVSAVQKNDDSITIEAGESKIYAADYVVFTPTIWSFQTSIGLEGFTTDDMPWEVVRARNEQHNISSCKVFFPLKETYWKTGSKIPQILVTDTFVQDAYGVQWSDDDPGVLLASYTWEDDALKMLALDDASLAELVLRKLDEITVSTTGEHMSSYVDPSSPVVIHWLDQRYFSGCAKLYRQRKWSENYALLTYNQEYSAASRVYFAGENYSVEGGWSEPALRTAIDAVVHIIHNSGGKFTVLNFEDYPTYDISFNPNQVYPRGNPG